MDRRYSNYTVEELREEIASLTEKAQKAEQMGMVNEYAVHERKIIMAKSYLLNPAAFKAGETYMIEGDPGHTFSIDYMNGIFAWGTRHNQDGENVTDGKEEALPIALLGEKRE